MQGIRTKKIKQNPSYLKNNINFWIFFSLKIQESGFILLG